MSLFSIQIFAGEELSKENVQINFTRTDMKRIKTLILKDYSQKHICQDNNPEITTEN